MIQSWSSSKHYQHSAITLNKFASPSNWQRKHKFRNILLKNDKLGFRMLKVTNVGLLNKKNIQKVRSQQSNFMNFVEYQDVWKR